jgi:hypothetical protein
MLRRADGHAHDTDLDALEIDRPHLGVVARPPGVPAPTAGRRQVPDNVTVRIEHRDPGRRHAWQRALTPRLPKQVRRLEQRRRLVALVLQQQRLLRCHGAHSNRRGPIPRHTPMRRHRPAAGTQTICSQGPQASTRTLARAMA